MGTVTYGDVFHQNEVEMSAYNFEHADVSFLFALSVFFSIRDQVLSRLLRNAPLAKLHWL